MARITRKAPPARRTPSEAMRRLRDSTVDAVEAGVGFATQTARAGLARTRKAALAGAARARGQAIESIGQFERVFERRVSSAIARLGVPTARDVHALSRQVAELQASVERLRRSRTRA